MLGWSVELARGGRPTPGNQEGPEPIGSRASVPHCTRIGGDGVLTSSTSGPPGGRAGGRIEPAFAAYDGDDPLAVVVRANLHCRRMLAGRRATGHPGEMLPQGRARDAAGALFGATGRTVAKAKLLKARAPDLAAAVRVGRLTLERGHSVLRRRRRPGARPAEPRLG
jgi:hypothetical protein